MVQHEFGLAHVTPAQVRRPPPAQRERQAQPEKTAQRKEDRSWAEIAASKPPSTKRTVSGAPAIAMPIPLPTVMSSQASMAQAIAAEAAGIAGTKEASRGIPPAQSAATRAAPAGY